MKPENTFIASVHRHIPLTSKGSKPYWMKNHNQFVSGVPDVWYSGRQSDLWVEYKYVPVTKPTTPVVPAFSDRQYGLSQQQLRWYRERFQEGRNVWVIVGFKPGGLVFRTLNEVEQGLDASLWMSREALGKMIYDFVELN